MWYILIVIFFVRFHLNNAEVTDSVYEVVMHKYKSEMKITGNTLVGKLDVVKNIYEVSIEIFPKAYPNDRANIIYIKRTGISLSAILPNQLEAAVFVNGKSIRNTHDQLPLNKWSIVKFKQERQGDKYVYSVLINNKVISNIINKNPVTYKDVSIFISKIGAVNRSPFSGYVRNLIIKMGSEKETKPKFIKDSRSAESAGAGFYLSRCTIDEFSTEELQSCFRLCLQNGQSRSFSYSHKTKKCLINNKRKRDRECKTVNEEGYLYFDVY